MLHLSSFKKGVVMKTKGCLHVHIKDGKIQSVFSHLSNFPSNCVIHLKPDVEMTAAEFTKTHPKDSDELKAQGDKCFDMGEECYQHEE